MLEPTIKGLTLVAKGVGFIANILSGGAEQEIAKQAAGANNAAEAKQNTFQPPNLSAMSFSRQQPQAPQRQAPNQTQAQFNFGRVDFRGQIDIAGAPAGSKAESNNSQVDMNMMGNPKKAA